jgi:hypothetical protein
MTSSNNDAHGTKLRASGDDGLDAKFDRTARRFESQATALGRGLQTALFIQRFKMGLMSVRGRA